jgi:hypothetical protein
MPKPNRLQAALNQKAHGQPLPQEAINQPAAPPAATRREPTRAGKIMVSGWLPLEARASLRLILAHHPDKLMQDLVIEAFNDLFAKYNVPQTARVTPTAKVG